MDVTQNIVMQYLLLFGSLAGIIISILFLTKHGNKKGYIIAPFTYFIDAFLFYLTIELAEYNIYIVAPQQILFWSTVVRLHALIILLAYIIIEPKRIIDNKLEEKLQKEAKK
jgi:hypothetical protein